VEIDKAGQLIDFVKECAQSHGATPQTPVFIRDGADGPMKRISQIKMGEDVRGRYIVLETSPVLLS